jgi:hypothetical protein
MDNDIKASDEYYMNYEISSDSSDDKKKEKEVKKAVYKSFKSGPNEDDYLGNYIKVIHL